MFSASALVFISANGGETGEKVQGTFNDLWSNVIASDPQTESALFIVGLVWVIFATCSAVFSLSKGWKKAGIGLCFAALPGLFLMFPQATLLAFFGFLSFVGDFIGRFVAFVQNYKA